MVTGTENALMTATLAEGTTYIHNAAMTKGCVTVKGINPEHLRGILNNEELSMHQCGGQ